MWMGYPLTHYSFIHRFGFGAERMYSAFSCGRKRSCGVRRVVASTYGQTRRHVEDWRTYPYHTLPFVRSSRTRVVTRTNDIFLSFVARVITFEMKMRSVRSSTISLDERVSTVSALMYFESAQRRRRFHECMRLARFCYVSAFRSARFVRRRSLA